MGNSLPASIGRLCESSLHTGLNACLLPPPNKLCSCLQTIPASAWCLYLCRRQEAGLKINKLIAHITSTPCSGIRGWFHLWGLVVPGGLTPAPHTNCHKTPSPPPFIALQSHSQTSLGACPAFTESLMHYSLESNKPLSLLGPIRLNIPTKNVFFCKVTSQNEILYWPVEFRNPK